MLPCKQPSRKLQFLFLASFPNVVVADSFMIISFVSVFSLFCLFLPTEGSSYAFQCNSDAANGIRNVFECGDGWCLDEDIDFCDSIINCPNFADETPEDCADRPGGWKGELRQMIEGW